MTVERSVTRLGGILAAVVAGAGALALLLAIAGGARAAADLPKKIDTLLAQHTSQTAIQLSLLEIARAQLCVSANAADRTDTKHCLLRLADPPK